MTPRARVAWQTAALVVVCTMCMWPTDSTVPSPGIDRAWSVGLSLARARGMQFGDDIVFTYGPLGHAYFPSSVTRSGLLVSIVLVATLCSVFIALSHRLLRLNNMGNRWFALGGAFFLVLLGPSSGAAFGDVAVFAVYATMIDALARRREIAAWWYPLLGAAAAGLLLGKVSTGIITAAGVGIFALAADERWKRVATAMAGFAVTLLVLWFGTGQSLSELLPWLRGAIEISEGYSSAMGREEPGRQWELLVVGLVVATLLVAAGRYILRRGRQAVPDRRPWIPIAGVALLSLGLFEFAFKEGFVRHDVHSGIFFFALVYVTTVLPHWSRMSTDGWPAAVGWLATVLCLFTSGGVSVSAALDPTPSAQAFTRVVNQLVDADSWREQLAVGRASARDVYQVPTEILVAAEGRSVHVDPYDLLVTWAYDLRWNPTPVFQRYSAYTAYLDQLNAAHLLGRTGPDQVLRSTDPAVDGRFDLLEAPQAMQAMMCNFAPIEQSERWQLLQRSSDRCATAPPSAAVRVAAGASIEIPAYDRATQAVLVQVDFDTGVFDVVRTTLYKSAEYNMTVDGRTYRVLPKMTGTPGLLYVPPSSGWADPFRGLIEPPTAVQFDHAAEVAFTIVDVAAT